MFINNIIFFKRTTFRVLLHTSSIIMSRKKMNPKIRKRNLERVCHLNMSSRSIIEFNFYFKILGSMVNNGKEDPTRRATWMLNARRDH